MSASKRFSAQRGGCFGKLAVIDLLLMDLMLPGLSGSELIAEIRKTSQTPVIVLPAKTEPSDKVELLGPDICAATSRQSSPCGSISALRGVGAVPGENDVDRRQSAGQSHRP